MYKITRCHVAERFDFRHAIKFLKSISAEGAMFFLAFSRVREILPARGIGRVWGSLFARQKRWQSAFVQLPEDSYHRKSCANKRTQNNRPHREEAQKKIKVDGSLNQKR